MKTTQTTWLKLLLLWATLAGVFPAHAYYDPGVQRWVNRDPAGERGDLNLYRCVRNSPLIYIDPHGLLVVIPPLEDMEKGLEKINNLCKCSNMANKAKADAEKYANDTYGSPGQTHNDEGSLADAMTHCIGACEIAKGEAPCKAAGIDVRGRVQAREADLSRPADQMDYMNNAIGFAIADSGKDCKQGCADAIVNGTIWVIPPGGTAGPINPPAPQPPPTWPYPHPMP